ncbi:MAG: hypothetical protein R2699_04000 [Acidimicrobiales bacterium]|nr:hypothetical protein [Acidimicrobiales bacterium]
MGVRRWIWTRLGGTLDADPNPDDWVLYLRGRDELIMRARPMLDAVGIEHRIDRTVYSRHSTHDELMVRRCDLERAVHITGIEPIDVLDEATAQRRAESDDNVWDVAHFSSVRAAERAVAVLAAADIGSWMRDPDPDAGDDQELSVGVKAEDRKKAAKVLEKERTLTGQFRLDDHIAWVRRSRG